MSDFICIPGNGFPAYQSYRQNRGSGGSSGGSINLPLRISVISTANGWRAVAVPGEVNKNVPKINGIAITASPTPMLPVSSGQVIFARCKKSGEITIETGIKVPDTPADWSDGTVFFELASVVSENDILTAVNKQPTFTTIFCVTVNAAGNPQFSSLAVLGASVVSVPPL